MKQRIKQAASWILSLCIVISMFAGVDFGFIKWDGLALKASAADLTGNFRVYYGSSATSTYADETSVAAAFNYITSYNWVKIENTKTGNPAYDLGGAAEGYNIPANKTLILTGLQCTYESGSGSGDLIQMQSGSTLYIGSGITLTKYSSYVAVRTRSSTVYNAGTIQHYNNANAIQYSAGTSNIYTLGGSVSKAAVADSGCSANTYTGRKLTLTNGTGVSSSSASGYYDVPYAANGEYWYTNGTNATVTATPSTGYYITSAGTVTMNADTTHNVTAALLTYSVSYDANGGSNAPTAQTKTYGVDLTLSSSVPTRTGYTFRNWNIAQAGNSTAYNSGATYATNAAATLYAQWTANQYEITFDAGDGTGGTESVTATYGSAMPTASVTMPTRDGYAFAGYWAGANGTGTRYYNANGTSAAAWNIANSTTTLYAKWVPLPTIAINRTAVNERSANDGGVSDTLIVTAQNGTFADNSGVTIENIPAGLTPVITRIDGTSLMISFSGKATSHASSNTVNNATITVAAGKITYLLYSGTNNTNAAALTTGSFSFVFRDAATSPNAPIFFGSDGTPGPAWADSVTLSSARLNSGVTVTGGTITERGFVYGKITELGGADPRIGGTGVASVQSGTGFGSFSANISVAANNEYSFAAYAKTDSGNIYYSDSDKFKPSALCSMGSTAVLPIRETQATIVGNVLTDGGGSISEIGVVYSTSPMPSIDDIEIGQGESAGRVVFATGSGLQIGSFSVDLDSLTAANLYYVRTYAINGSGVAYGAQVTMSTLTANLDDRSYLSNLTVDGGTMVPAFNKDVHSYMVSVPSARNNIQVTPFLADSSSKVVVTVKDQNWLKANGNTTSSGKSATIVGINGSAINVVWIEVTDKDGNVRTYILNMMMMPSNSADVLNVTLRTTDADGTPENPAVTLTPTFDTNQNSYTAIVSPDVNVVNVELDKGTNTWLKTKINGVAPANDDTALRVNRDVTLTGPSTTITVQATSQDGKTTKNYTILVIRRQSSSAYLNGLDVGENSGGTEYNAKLTPTFDSMQLTYGVAVGMNTDNIWFTPKVDAGAVVSVSATTANGTVLTVSKDEANGSFNIYTLQGGNNTVNIIVTSPDGSTECAYTVIVTKKVSDNTDLSNLVVRANTTSANAASGAAQTLMPPFAADETAYTVVVENNMAYAHITPTKADVGASYYFSGSPTYNADATFSKDTPLVLPLNPGSNEIFLHVVAADGLTVNTTIITIIRKISSDATLSNIEGLTTLAPRPELPDVFYPNQGVFSAEVDFATTSKEITATPTVDTSTIALTVNGVTKDPQAGYTAGARTDNVDFKVGINTLIYTVTAQDGVTTRQYTVEVIRTVSDNAWLATLDFGDNGEGGIAPGTQYDMTPPAAPEGKTYVAKLDGEGNTLYYYYLDDDNDEVIAMEDYPGFDSYTLDYVEAVANTVTTTKIKATPQDTNATMTYSIDGGENFIVLESDTDSADIPLSVGNNEIIIKVVAQDGETIKEYSLNIVRYGSDDSTLVPVDENNPNGGLWATNLKDGLNPDYGPTELIYTASTEPRFDTTDITAKTNDADAKVFIKRQQRDEDGDQIFDEYDRPVVDTLISGVSGATATDAPLEYGENIFFIEVVAANGSSQTYTLTITREPKYDESDLDAEIDPDTFTFPSGLIKTRDKTYILDYTTDNNAQTIKLTPAEDKPIGIDLPDYDVTYSFGDFDNSGGVLTGKPELDEDDGKTIKFTGAAGAVLDAVDSLEIIIHTPNYEDKTVTLYFKAVEKTAVDITVDDDKTPENKDYDGDPVPKPGNDDLEIAEEESPNTDRTEEIVDKAEDEESDSEITYIYKGKDGTEYESTEPPTDAGSYELIITIIDEDYEGEKVIEFTIAKKALTIDTAAHTRVYDSTTAADGVVVTFTAGGVIAADAGNVSPDEVTAEYTLATAGTQTVNITGVTLTGSRSHNYTVTATNGKQLIAPAGDTKIGITKAPGLTATTPADITIYEKLKTTKNGTFNLGNLAPTAPFGVTGDVSYAAKSELLSDGFNIFTAGGKPSVSGSTLNYTAAAGKAPNLTATQVITITTDNFEDITVTLTFKTIPRKSLTITPDNDNLDKEYDGEEIDPNDLGDLTIEDEDGDPVILKPNPPDGNVTYEYHGYDSEGVEYGPDPNPPTDAGDYTLTITVEDDEHVGELVIPFTIEKATPDITVPSLSATYGDTLGSVSLTGATAKLDGDDVAGTFAWTSGDGTLVGNAGNRTHNVTFKPTDTKNYNIVYENAMVVVAKATPVVDWPDVSDGSYGDTLADLTLSNGSAQHSATDTTNVPGTFTWNAPDTELDTDDSDEEYRMTFTPDDTDNYFTVSDDVAVGTVVKADGLIVSLRDPILYITAGTSPDSTYSLVSPNVMLSGPIGAPIAPTFSIEGAISDSTGIFTNGTPISPNIANSTDLNYKPGGSQTVGQTATVTIKISSSNYSDITTDIQFVVIDKTPVLISNVTPDNATYDTQQHSGYTGAPVITESVLGDKTDDLTTELVYTYEGRNGTSYGPNATKPTDAGDYKLTISIDTTVADGGGKFYKGEKEINFSIAKAIPTVNWPQDLGATYGDTLTDVDLPTDNGTGTAGGFSWTAGDSASVGLAGSRLHNVTFEPTDTDNYEIVNQNVTVSVAKANPNVTWPTGLSGTYGSSLGTVTLPGNGSAKGVDDANLPGTFTWDAPGTSLTTGSLTYSMTFTPSDTANYNPAQENVAVNVGKASGLNVTPSSLNINIKLSATAAATFNVANAVTLSRADTGDVEYAIGALTGTTSIFDSTPLTISSDGVLSYTPSSSKLAGQTATQIITISTENYNSVTVTITFTVLPKTHVEIQGITPEDAAYDGNEHDGYTGTPEIISEEDGLDKFFELTAAGDIEYIYKDDGGTPLPGKPTAPGDYTLTIKVADDNDDFEGEKTINFTIDKADASDLEVEPDSITIKIRQAATSAASYDVKTNVTLTPPAGCSTGDVTYTIGTLSGDGIFTANPSIDGTTGVLSYTPSATKTVGQEAEQIIKITTDNYEDVFVTVKFEVIAKTEVTIGGLTGEDGQYNSSDPTATHDGYDDSNLEITDEDDKDLTTELEGELEYIYNGTLSDGTTYGPDSTTPPTEPGEYTVTVKVPDSNTDYTGSVDIDFIIEKEDGPGAPSLVSDPVTNYGGSDGKITITDYGPAYTYEYSDDGGTTWQDATVNAGGEIDDLPAGTYEVRVKETDTTEAGDTATITITQPRGITLTIMLDGQPWTAHGTELGKAFTLEDSGGSTIPAANNSTGALVNFNVTADGTYAVYADSADTGLTVTLSSGADTATEAVNYYTVSFAIDGGGLTGDIAATYDGAGISSGDIVLGGGGLVITAEGTDINTDVYVYTWTGAGTTSASGDTLNISSLGETVDATCVIAGVNAGITVSLEGLGGLKYGDTVNGKAIFTLDDENGTFEYAGAAPATFAFSLEGTEPEIGEENAENEGETDSEAADSDAEDETDSNSGEESEADVGADTGSDGESGADAGDESTSDADAGGESDADTDNEADSTVGAEDVASEDSDGEAPGTGENNEATFMKSANTAINLQPLSSNNYSIGMLRSMSIGYSTPGVTDNGGADDAEIAENETDDNDANADTQATGAQIGTFAANIITYQFNPSAFTVNGLAGSGLTAGTAIRKSNTVVEVPITGTITNMGTITLTAPSTIAKENVVNAQKDIPINGTVTFTLTISKASQPAPNVTANENHETDEHSIGGIDDTMEYSTDGGQTWIPYDDSNPPDLTGDVEIWVRYEGTDTHEPSPPTILTFHEKGTLGGTASITGTPKVGQTLTVDTSGITGNANRSTLRYQWQRDGVDISGETSVTYVAVADDVNKTISCIVTSTAEYGSVTAPGVTVTADSSGGGGDRDSGDDGGNRGGGGSSSTPDTTPPPRTPSEPPAEPSSSTPSPESQPAPMNPVTPVIPAPTVPAESSAVEETEPESTGPALPSETIKETTVYNFGDGSVTITIVKDDGQDSIVAVVDTKTAIEAILSPEELARVAAGEHAEIQINIRHLIEELKEVPEADRISIEDSIDKFATQIDGLKLGKYIDITMQYRIGGGEWIPITEAREEIELTIDIPEDLLEDDSTYFIMRCHDGYTVLLHDLDDAHETITIATKLFSTYAIVYTSQEVVPEAVEEINDEHKCWLCGFCPEPFGICIFIWLLILIAVGVTIYIIMKRKKKKDEEKEVVTTSENIE